MGCNTALVLHPPNNARFVQIVRGHFHFDAVANGESSPALTHFPRDGCQDEVLVVEFDSEHSSWQDGMDYSFDFDWRFFHKAIWATSGSNRLQHLADEPEREAPDD